MHLHLCFSFQKSPEHFSGKGLCPERDACSEKQQIWEVL